MRSKLSTFSAIVAGAILLTAALLKSSSSAAMLLSPLIPIPAIWSKMAILPFEFALGFWLILKPSDPGVRLTATLAFIAMVLLNAFNGALGASSCGCFGEIVVSPWTMFVLDLLIAVVLVITSEGGFRVMMRTGWSGLFLFFVSIAFSLAIFGLGVVAQYGTPGRFLAAMRNEPLVVRPTSLNFGSDFGNSIVERPVEIENRSNQVIRIIGATSDCSCASTSALPLEIAPGETRSVMIILRFPPNRGIVQRTSQLWTDRPGDSALTIVLSGYSRGIRE